MMNRKFIWIAFVFLSIINAVIYLNRDHFKYQSYPAIGKLYEPCDEACIKKWKQFKDDYPLEELESASKIMDTVLNGSDSSVKNKVIRIGHFLFRKFKEQQGTPTAELLAKSPFQQYQSLALSANEKAWCGNWANMFAWFCWSKGISTRIIEIMRPGDHHVVNEFYDPATNSWIMTDLTNNMLLIKNEKGEELNLSAFMDLAEKKSTVNVLRSGEQGISQDLLLLPNDSISHYYNKSYTLHYYYRNNLKAVYSGSSRLKRYLLPHSWYSVVEPGEEQPTNTGYYIKIFFLFAWVLTGLALLFSKSRIFATFTNPKKKN